MSYVILRSSQKSNNTNIVYYFLPLRGRISRHLLMVWGLGERGHWPPRYWRELANEKQTNNLNTPIVSIAKIGTWQTDAAADFSATIAATTPSTFPKLAYLVYSFPDSDNVFHSEVPTLSKFLRAVSVKNVKTQNVPHFSQQS